MPLFTSEDLCLICLGNYLKLSVFLYAIQSQVEEIDDIEDSSGDPFVTDAIANERELNLSEEQKRKFKKVCERYILVLFFDIDTSFLENMAPDEMFIAFFFSFSLFFS